MCHYGGGHRDHSKCWKVFLCLCDFVSIQIKIHERHLNQCENTNVQFTFINTDWKSIHRESVGKKWNDKIDHLVLPKAMFPIIFSPTGLGSFLVCVASPVFQHRTHTHTGFHRNWCKNYTCRWSPAQRGGGIGMHAREHTRTSEGNLAKRMTV